MKLSLTQQGVTVTIEHDAEGQTCSQMVEYMRQLLLGQGYHPETVDEALSSDN